MAGLHSAHGTRLLKTFVLTENIQVLQLAATQTVASTIAHYRASGQVEFAEPDYILHTFAVPNDPKFSDGTQWHLNNTGQGGGLAGADIHAPGGWDTLASASNTVVAVIDTGVRITHEDLAENLWRNPGELPGNGLDDDRDGYADDMYGINALANTGDPSDDNGHGTHIAGIIGAAGNNGKGVTGVAWRVQLMACKFMDQTGHGEVSDAVACIDYAIKKGAKIINASWGNTNYSLALEAAVRSAQRAGVILVAAAGNEMSDNDVTPVYPASLALDNVVAVAATTSADVLDSSYSNFGARSVDLAAPGTAVYSTWFTNRANPGAADRAYAYLSGTSMAAPQVTGVLALMRARFPNDTYRQLINRLLAATDPLAGLAGKCITGGRVNLQKALTAPLVADFTATPMSGAVPLTVRFTNWTVGTFASQAWDFGDNTPTTNEANPTHVYNEEGSFTVTLTVTGTNGVKTAKSRVISAFGNYHVQPATYQWIDPSGMIELYPLFGGLTKAVNLPYPVYFYGQAYKRIYVSAYGLVTLTDPGLVSSFNADLPNPLTPNAFIAAYWDDLNPLLGGSVRVGIVGTAPKRRLVVAWVGVPRTFSFGLPLTFQAVLEEGSNQILFQYREVHPQNSDGGGRRATIGLENQTGRIAAKYAYRGSPQIVTNGQAFAFVPSSSANLAVTPATGLESAGKIGGPFVPESQTFAVQNTGQASLDWSVAKTQNWISLSLTNGVLAPGQMTNVIVTLNPLAADLNAGSYLDTLSFSNLRTGNGNTTRTVALAINGTNSVLEVAPESGSTAIGPPGGPFNPASQICTLINTGDASLDWTAAGNQEWIGLSALSGVLRPGESAVVAVAVSTNAILLPPGSYTGRVDFANRTSGQGNTSRAFRLVIATRPTLTLLPPAGSAGFALRLAGESGVSYVLEASTNLIRWVPLATNGMGANAWFDFVEPLGGSDHQRFYRGKVLPP